MAEYCRIRLVQDPHLQATTLFEEVVGLGAALRVDLDSELRKLTAR